MFDAATSALLRSAPAVPGLNPNDIPQLITRHYAALVSARLRGTSDSAPVEEHWSLERIADTYEIITSISDDADNRRASAFVAATAHQVLSRRQSADGVVQAHSWSVNRDGVDPAVASTLLFLAAEQYADANEAASAIRLPDTGLVYEARILAEHIRDLARGQLIQILEWAIRWRRTEAPNFTIQTRAFLALLETLVTGIEIFAAEVMSMPIPPASAGRFDSAQDAFLSVLQLSTNSNNSFIQHLAGDLFTTYGGPRHLAALLLAAERGMRDASLTHLPPPDGAAENFWRSWLTYRAKKFPFVWPNHREAIARGFHQTEKSAVVVLPTGAGKTTVSSLKIAGVLARKKKVIFLAPTHALVEQLTEDLQEMFPEEVLGSLVSSDFDSLLMDDAQLKEIEVMTPEGFLAMLSFAPGAFSEVGLLVFDECHLLSPQSGKIRRALDGMLSLLAFNRIVPEACTLFLSAMLKNGKEFADWIGHLTSRECIAVDLLWKPSRQARGVVIYQDKDLSQIKKKALEVQKKQDKKAQKQAKSLRADAKRELLALPHAIWGLQHNWLSTNTAYCSFTSLSEDRVPLAGTLNYYGLRLLPNANQVASRLAVAAAKTGLKTIVFVNTKADAVSTADSISTQLGDAFPPTEAESDRWLALRTELGHLSHSILKASAAAVPHNSSMLRLERELAQRMFCRPDGAQVIVATPTLAQGLNLPPHLAILAGDKRANTEKGSREDLEAHEILNAAARAGRAGHLANGIVLLVPEPIISFSDDCPPAQDVVNKLRLVLPEDDRCVTISDPLEIVLDQLMEGKTHDRDVRYTINRMAVLGERGAEASSLFDLDRSFGAYAAKTKANEQDFDRKLAKLKTAIDNEAVTENLAPSILALASQSGLPGCLLQKLKTLIQTQVGSLPTTIEGWVGWVIEWLATDDSARELLLFDVAGSIAAATKIKAPSKAKSAKPTQKEPFQLSPAMMRSLLPGVIAWIEGKPLREIELVLGGEPDSDLDTLKICPRARELVSSIIPRGFAFIMSLISRVVEDLDPFEQQEGLESGAVHMLSTAVRRGFDTPEKLAFANENKNILTRVQAHLEYARMRLLDTAFE